MFGTQIDEYRAPLVVAWQLTNRCTAACLACCEDSGPDRGWRDELTRPEALNLARQIIEARIPYVAFGGGEPLGVPHCWEIFEQLAAAGIGIKLETDARYIDADAADRLSSLPVQCIQVSVDGATASTHERVRPGSSFSAAIGAIERLVARACAPQFVFVPTRLNHHEAPAAYDLASDLGCEAFVTGPLMRLGRAAGDWQRLACSEREWQQAVHALRERAGSVGERAQSRGATTKLSIYPWDILEELARRLESPQAMLLVVPNGMVKLMNALPFVAAQLPRDGIAAAWSAYRRAWRSREVADFVVGCRADPAMLRHANDTWKLETPSAP
ncbi:MAG TPA: radical SAM protein [Steroidobacteraceae bacterium]|nr:radical SAM protein [Steroidobacteraceae bacterium]